VFVVDSFLQVAARDKEDDMQQADFAAFILAGAAGAGESSRTRRLFGATARLPQL